MKFGFSIFPTHYSISPPIIAAAIEQFGFESIWFPEHSHMPTNTVFPLPDGVVPDHDVEIPRNYLSTLDPFVSLGAAAAVTEKIKLGTAICLVVQRDPFNCAKEVSTLDQISNGRVIFGIGAGWNSPELENHGTDPSTRFRLMRERVEAMKALWTNEEAEYHGRYVDFGPTWQWPKPLQKPHPPIVLGGIGPNTFKRIASYGDGWMPIITQTSLEDLQVKIPELNNLCADQNRPKPEISLMGSPLNDIFIASLEKLGVSRVVIGLESLPEKESLSQLEHRAEQIAQLRP